MPGPEPTDAELLEAKKRIYHLLLRKANPTEAEVKVMYELVFDHQIRAFLKEHINNPRTESEPVDTPPTLEAVQARIKYLEDKYYGKPEHRAECVCELCQLRELQRELSGIR